MIVIESAVVTLQHTVRPSNVIQHLEENANSNKYVTLKWQN